MPAGTITLKNNSAAVTGSGTAFSSELKTNDFLVVTVGQTVYTLGVKSVESNTALTLVRNFEGPTASGLAWTPIPYGAMVSITAQTHAYTAEAMRGLLLDKRNWQQVFSGSGEVTVRLPDGSSFTGPAWNELASLLDTQSDKLDEQETQLKDTLSKTATSAQEIKSDLSIDGEVTLKKKLTVADLGTFPRIKATGGANYLPSSQGAHLSWNRTSGGGRTDFINHKGGGSGGFDFWNGNETSQTRIFGIDGSGAIACNAGARIGTDLVVGQTAQFNNSMISKGDGINSGGEVQAPYLYFLPYGTADGIHSFMMSTDIVGNRFEHRIVTSHPSSGVQIFAFKFDGNAWCRGTWQNGSDRRIKTDIHRVENALDKQGKINGYTFKKSGNDDAGVIAQELIDVLPQAVVSGGDYELKDGTVVKDCLGVAYSALSALFIEAIKELNQEVKTLKERLEKYESMAG